MLILNELMQIIFVLSNFLNDMLNLYYQRLLRCFFVQNCIIIEILNILILSTYLHIQLSSLNLFMQNVYLEAGISEISNQKQL